jgi:hypothetical protein
MAEEKVNARRSLKDLALSAPCGCTDRWARGGVPPCYRVGVAFVPSNVFDAGDCLVHVVAMPLECKSRERLVREAVVAVERTQATVAPAVQGVLCFGGRVPLIIASSERPGAHRELLATASSRSSVEARNLMHISNINDNCRSRAINCRMDGGSRDRTCGAATRRRPWLS